jgi:hypothetical protein
VKKLFLLVFLFVTVFTWANTPGRHTVTLTWTETNCPACTFNIYRGTTASVCSGSPTPYAANINGLIYTDLNPPVGAVFYNVSAVDPAKGGESACDGEAQTTVPPITTPVPANFTPTVQ